MSFGATRGCAARNRSRSVWCFCGLRLWVKIETWGSSGSTAWSSVAVEGTSPRRLIIALLKRRRSSRRAANVASSSERLASPMARLSDTTS